MSKNALLAHSKKDGLEGFGKELIELGFKLWGSKGTAEYLSDNGCPATDVATLVGHGPILNHKVVTLSCEIAAGCLVNKEDPKEMAEFGLLGSQFVCFDLVSVGFYPLEEEVWKPEATSASVRAMKDVGGPTLATEAGKGRRIVICDRRDEDEVLKWMKAGEPLRDHNLQRLEAKADYVVGSYRLHSAKYLDYPDLRLPPKPDPVRLVYPPA